MGGETVALMRAHHKTLSLALPVSLIIAGALTAFYVVGLPLIAIGTWLAIRRESALPQPL